MTSPKTPSRPFIPWPEWREKCREEARNRPTTEKLQALHRAMTTEAKSARHAAGKATDEREAAALRGKAAGLSQAANLVARMDQVGYLSSSRKTRKTKRLLDRLAANPP